VSSGWVMEYMKGIRILGYQGAEYQDIWISDFDFFPDILIP